MDPGVFSPVIRVLLLEASEADRNYVLKILSEENVGQQRNPAFQLAFFDRLDDALERLREDNFDAILTELTLPDSRGLQTFERLHKVAAELPIVILSDLDDEKLAYEAVRLGAQDYLPKAKLNANNLPRILRYGVERKRIQQQVYAAEAKYRSIFENSAVAILVADQNGCIVSWNRFAENLLGMHHDDLYLKPVYSLFTEKDWDQLRKRDLREKGICPRLESKAVTRSGAVIDVDASIAVLKDAPGNVTGCIYILKDTTEQKKIESMKDEFMHTVSHELKTPLAIVREAVAQMLEGLLGETTQEQRKFLNICLDNIDRLARIVNDLLNAAKLEMGKMELKKELVELVGLVQKVSGSFEARAKRKGITIQIQSDQPALSLYADKDKLAQVFTNLIGNALKFTDQGRVDISLADRQDFIECRVADTGRGIAEQDLPKVFSKFQQFGRRNGSKEEGTGLGLSISKRMIELHHGKIEVASRDGKGTVFQFTVPKSTIREVFREKITEKLQEAVRKAAVFSIVIYDLTDYQSAGVEGEWDAAVSSILQYLEDWMTQNLGRRVESVLKDSRLIFMVLPATKKSEALIFAGRIRQILEDALAREQLLQFVPLHCKIASYPEDGQTAEEFMSSLETSRMTA